MKIEILKFAFIVFLFGCSDTYSTPQWVKEWEDSSLHDDRLVYDVLNLTAGSESSIEIKSDEDIVVGFWIESAQIHQTGGSLILKDKKDNSWYIRSTVGAGRLFKSKNGMVSLVIENQSSVDTGVLIHTPKPSLSNSTKSLSVGSF